jgi:hypothetical protein
VVQDFDGVAVEDSNGGAGKIRVDRDSEAKATCY